MSGERMSRSSLILAVDLHCTHCGALPDEPCRQSNGNSTWPHRERESAAKVANECEEMKCQHPRCGCPIEYVEIVRKDGSLLTYWTHIDPEGRHRRHEAAPAFGGGS